MNKQKRIASSKAKFSIGIPTYEAGESLVTTVKSITEQTCYRQIDKILIVVDGNKIPRRILNKLVDKKIEIVYFSKREGQTSRINNVFQLLNTEKIVLTNDDVILAKNSLEIINKNHNNFDLVAGNVMSLDEKSLFQRCLIIGQKIRANASKYWNDGNNYLGCNGRLLVLSIKLYKQLTIPKIIWNNDAYIYIKCQELGLKFAFSKELIAYYKLPSVVEEHVNQSSKFQNSKTDLQQYFNNDISDYYKIPAKAIIRSSVQSFAKHPILSSIYLIIFLGTRLGKKFTIQEFGIKSYWDTDESTKKI